jgi:two-component sensor histidine kinase
MLGSDPFSGRRNGRTLAQAVVDTLHEPLLVLDSDARVVAASRSFCRTFRVSAEETQGRLLWELGSGQWDIAVLRQLLDDVIPRHAAVDGFEVEHDFPGVGRRVMRLSAREIGREGDAAAELLVVIEDVTARRAAEREKDELLRQKELLLEEMQHRVNNSLQIIASILLLKARTVQSEETRRHLEDAHQRVLSMAAVQTHLRALRRASDDIQVGPYLSKLCASLGQAMIVESRPLVLEVEADPGSMTATQAVSLGLIATELVINALKHAFPERSAGRVVVAYRIVGDGWRFSVSDDGVGKAAHRDGSAPAGLGTSLVEVLARQLGGEVEVTTGPRGTIVAVVRRAGTPESA